jgi:UDPglucose 6-dehydrogenase
LEELFNKNLANGRIKFTTEMSSVSEADFIIIAVGTPPNPITKEADISYIYAASDEIASYLQKDKYVVVANKSTVPVGTGDKVDEIIKNKNPSAQFDVISMPEFLREGFAVYDFFNPSRVVVGANSEIARESVERLYSIFQTRPNIFFTERRSAELIKYASNAFLAVKIHYINEIADFCEKVNVNVYDVAKGMGLDCRIGNKFLNPGPGYGGSCFPKDTNALAFMAREKDVDLSLIEATIVGNDNRKIKMANRIFNSIKDIEKPLVAVWGLAFKDGTDDVRESPAIQIIQELISRGVKIVAYDPKAMESAKAILGNAIEYANNPIIATKNADVLAILTEWKIFKEIPLNSLSMRHKLIIDLRRIIDKEVAISAGFDYDGVGKK